MAPVVVQRLMGHNDISVTLNTYTSVYDKFKEKEIDKVSKIVNAVLKDHPELFYIKEWSLNTKGLFNFEYSMKEKEILKDQKRIKKIVKQLKEDTQNLKSYQK